MKICLVWLNRTELLRTGSVQSSLLCSDLGVVVCPHENRASVLCLALRGKMVCRNGSDQVAGLLLSLRCNKGSFIRLLCLSVCFFKSLDSLYCLHKEHLKAVNPALITLLIFLPRNFVAAHPHLHARMNVLYVLPPI